MPRISRHQQILNTIASNSPATSYAPLSHTTDASAHSSLFSSKAPADHNHSGVYQSVGDYALSSHNHDSSYSASGHNHDSSYSPSSHNHDSSYSQSSHNHNSSYVGVSERRGLGAMRKRGTTTQELWYSSPSAGSSLITTTALSANRIYAMPFPVWDGCSIDRIGVYVNTGASNALIRLGIYDSISGGGYPGNLIIDAGTVDASVSTTARTITISQSISAGTMCWLVCLSGHTPTIRYHTVSGLINIGWLSTFAAAPVFGYYYAYNMAALPVSFGSSPTAITSGVAPAIFVRLSS